MTFLAPGLLALGAAAAIALVALHLLAIGRPAPWLLPTARFVPARSARARRLTRRPADRVLLAMRVAAALLAALALARPTRTPARRPLARVILADASRAVGDAREVRDSVRALASAGDLVVAFDTATRAAERLGEASMRDSTIAAFDVAPSAPAAGSLSAALVAARRAVPMLRETADSVELVIVSPLTAREVDAATVAVRATWAGRGRVVRVGVAPDDSGMGLGEVRGGTGDDVLAAASGPVIRAATPASPTRSYRILRGGLAPSDSSFARDSGAVVVDWPMNGAPAGWARRERADTVGAVVASGGRYASAVFVAPMVRTSAAPPGAAVIARWVDGAAAATERAVGRGCIREVAVPVPQVGDAALRAPFRAFFAAMTAPCASTDVGAPIDAAAVQRLAGSGPLLATSTLAAPAAPRDPIARWLLAAALLCLFAELPLRAFVPRKEGEHAPDEALDASAAATREVA